MLIYILNRLLIAVPAVLGVTLVVFFLTRVLGDPAILLLPPEAEVTPQQLAQLRAALGLDEPLWRQYVGFLRGAVQGDFGDSFFMARPAMEVVVERLWATTQLAVAALLIAIALGIPAGVVAALHRNSLVDLGISTVSLLGLSMPNFWLGLMLVLIFGVNLQWLPVSGRGTFAHLVLPALTLGTALVAVLARLVRADMLEVMSQDYVRTAAAKGVRPAHLISRHALKNAMIPTVTMIGLQFGALLGGAVVVESVFAWPGLGRLLLQAISRRDFPVVQAGVIIFALIFLLVNLLVDLAYAYLDPRIRYN